MKSKLGITLRKIRKGKKISLSSIADSNLSKSQISRFERGESEISCIRLINILDKLHVTLDEFLILHDDDYTNSESFANLVQYIRKQYSSQSIDNIACLLSDTTNYTLDPLEKTMVKSILHTMDSRIIPSDEELLQLTDYLFKVEKWGYYEFKRELSSGIETMKQAIQVFDILGEDELKLHYTDHFNKLVNKK